MRFQVLLLTALWATGVLSGSWLLYRYKSMPGRAGPSPITWPADSGVRPAHERPLLIVFIHPRCPCSRATIDGLAQLAARCPKQVDVCVFVFKPSGSDATWERTDLWQSAEQIPGLTVLTDLDGAEAHRFAVETSGHTLLYDRQGTLQFSGGITGSRGHAGDNAGLSAVEAAIGGVTPKVRRTPVFGCPIFNENKPTR